MKIRTLILVITTMIVSGGAAHAEPTVSRKIQSVDLQGADGSVFVKGVGGWGIYCSGVTVDSVIFSKETIPAGYNAMLAMVMSAYVGGKSIRFYGGCAPDKGAGIYKGTYLIVSD